VHWYILLAIIQFLFFSGLSLHHPELMRFPRLFLLVLGIDIRQGRQCEEVEHTAKKVLCGKNLMWPAFGPNLKIPSQAVTENRYI